MKQISLLSVAKLLYDRTLPYSPIASIQRTFICYHQNVASNEMNWEAKGATRVSSYHAVKLVGCKRDRK